MEEKIKNYEKIVNDLINKSFPILKNKKIKVEIRGSEFSACASWGLIRGRMIEVNPKYADIYNDFELKGIFSHELCHLEDWKINGYFYMVINCIKCFFSSKLNKEYEKQTDTNAVHKGYRKELVAQRKKRFSINDKNLKKLKKTYLTPDEIENIN